MFADPTDRIVDIAIFVLSKIENIHLARSPFQWSEYRVKTVLNIQVGLPLLAVAKHLELARIDMQLIQKVIDMTMGVALSQDRNKTKNVTGKPEPLTIGGNQSFTGKFRGA